MLGRRRPAHRDTVLRCRKGRRTAPSSESPTTATDARERPRSRASSARLPGLRLATADPVDVHHAVEADVEDAVGVRVRAALAVVLDTRSAVEAIVAVVAVHADVVAGTGAEQVVAGVAEQRVVPGPPARRSLSSLPCRKSTSPPPKRLSSPVPPNRSSRPPPPLTLSLPTSPCRNVSSPAWPRTMSLPWPAWTRSAPRRRGSCRCRLRR